MVSSAESGCQASPSPRNYYAVMTCSDSATVCGAQAAACVRVSGPRLPLGEGFQGMVGGRRVQVRFVIQGNSWGSDGFPPAEEPLPDRGRQGGYRIAGRGASANPGAQGTSPDVGLLEGHRSRFRATKAVRISRVPGMGVRSGIPPPLNGRLHRVGEVAFGQSVLRAQADSGASSATAGL